MTNVIFSLKCLIQRGISKIYVSMLCFHAGSQVLVCLCRLFSGEPALATVSGSQLRPAAARRSSMSPAETLLRLIQGEIMGPATLNPLKSSSTARQQAGREAQWSAGWTRLPKGAAIRSLRP